MSLKPPIKNFSRICLVAPTLRMSPSQLPGTSSGCRWRRRPPDIESGYEYTEYAAIKSQKGVLL